MKERSSPVMQVQDLTVDVVETGAPILKGVSFELRAERSLHWSVNPAAASR